MTETCLAHLSGLNWRGSDRSLGALGRRVPFILPLACSPPSPGFARDSLGEEEAEEVGAPGPAGSRERRSTGL